MKRLVKKFFKQRKIVIIIEFLILILGIFLLVNFLTNKENNIKENPIKNENNNIKEEIKKLNILDENTTSRPYAVMINNISTARPYQSGLQDAYVIYEIIVEGGITRYLALFLDQETDRIGSIRSARHYFLDYALENDAIYIHHGQSPQAEEDFSNKVVDRIEIDNNNTGWRDKSLKVSYEHTLFTNIEKIEKGLKNKRTKRNNDLLFNYSVDDVKLNEKENSQKATNISIKYSKAITSSYVYDEEAETYKRFINNKEHIDYVTKEQYTFKNIITYQVENVSIKGDTKGRQTLNNIGSGTGYFISNGYAQKINWIKECRSCQTKYTYEDGSEIVLNDGNTFIQIQPKGEELKIS